MSESRSPAEEENEENNESVSEKIISYGKQIIKKIQGWDGKASRAQIWVLIVFGVLFLPIGYFISSTLSIIGILLVRFFSFTINGFYNLLLILAIVFTLY